MNEREGGGLIVSVGRGAHAEKTRGGGCELVKETGNGL